MSITQNLSSQPIVRTTATFLRWWGQELTGIARPLLRGKTPKAGEARILLEQDRVIIERQIGTAGERFVDDRPLDTFDGAAFADLNGLVAEMRTKLCLQPPDIFVSELTLPLAVRGRLESAVALQMSEIAPLRPELLNWAITDRRIDGEHIHVRVAMAKTARIEAICSAFEQHDMAPPPIYAMDGDQEAPLRAIDQGGLSWLDLGKNGSALIAGLLLFSIPLTTLAGSAILTARAGWAAQALTQQVHDMRLAQRTAERMEERRQLLAPLHSQVGAAAILNELARRLPQDDWLRSVERKPNGAISLMAVTQDEAGLDKALRASPLLPGARVSDRSVGEDDSVDVSYVTDAR